MDTVEQVKDYVLEHNPGGDLPYHGNEHTAGVVRVLQQILATELPPCQGEYTQRDIDNLLTAAWFHDYAHSGGQYPDSVNIARAIVEAATYLTEVGRDEDVLPVTGYIYSTMYPSITPPEELLERCLRDADVLQATVEGKVELVMEGLRQEMGVRQGRVVSLEEMVQQQKDFMASLILYTDTGRHLWQMHCSDYLEAIEAYVAAQREKGRG